MRWLLLLAAITASPAVAQVPDNRGLKLDADDDAPPAYRETLEDSDRQRLEEAKESGGSFLPNVQGAFPNPAPPAKAPSPAPPPPAPPPAPVRQTPPPTYERLDRVAPGGGGLSELLGVLLETWNQPPEFVRMRFPAPQPPATTDPAPPPPAAQPSRLPSIAPGAGFYARTKYAVNSDYSGPVILEILQPPLVGAILTGSFEMVRDRLVLRLTQIHYRDETAPVDALAAGLDCACYGIEGEIDRHFLSRLLIPAAIRFAEGFATARGQPERSVTVAGETVYEQRSRPTTRQAVYTGAAAVARSFGDILLQDAPRRPTVRIPRHAELVAVFARSPAGPAAASPPETPDE